MVETVTNRVQQMEERVVAGVASLMQKVHPMANERRVDLLHLEVHAIGQPR